MATGHSSYSKLVTTTLQNHGTKVFDAVSTNNAFFYMLKKRNNVKIESGGRKFTHPIWYKQNSSFGSYGKLDTISTPIVDDLTRAVYDPKIIAGSIVLSAVDEAMNAGSKTKLLSIAETTRMAAEKSMTEVMGDQVWKDGNIENDFDGLRFLISDSPSTQSDVGGIDASATGNEYWRNTATTTSVTAFNTSQEGLTAMNALRLACTYGTEGPTAVFTTKAIYNLYELGMTSNIRYLKTELADAAFMHLAYMTMPVLFDDNAPANHLYMVDMNNLWLQILARGNFVVTPFQISHDQLSRTALMYLIGNLTTGSRRTQGVLTSVA